MISIAIALAALSAVSVSGWGVSTNYIWVPYSMNWLQANSFCQRHFHTTLATIRNPHENNEAKALRRANSWFGLNDRAGERHFKFVDGSPASYFNWAPGEPNNVGGGPGEDCTEIYGDGRWNDNNCNARRPFLCNRRRPECNCWSRGGRKIPCSQTPFAHLDRRTGLYWAWASPCSGGCSKLRNPIPFGWRRATDAEFRTHPNIYFFGYKDAMSRDRDGQQINSGQYQNVCAANIFDTRWKHCDAINFKQNRVTNKEHGHYWETLLVHDSGGRCPRWSEADEQVGAQGTYVFADVDDAAWEDTSGAYDDLDQNEGIENEGEFEDEYVQDEFIEGEFVDEFVDEFVE